MALLSSCAVLDKNRLQCWSRRDSTKAIAAYCLLVFSTPVPAQSPFPFCVWHTHTRTNKMTCGDKQSGHKLVNLKPDSEEQMRFGDQLLFNRVMKVIFRLLAHNGSKTKRVDLAFEWHISSSMWGSSETRWFSVPINVALLQLSRTFLWCIHRKVNGESVQ